MSIVDASLNVIWFSETIAELLKDDKDKDAKRAATQARYLIQII